MTTTHCTAGNPELCCQPGAWQRMTAMGEHGFRTYGEPLPEAVIDLAASHRIDPHALDWHVEAVHGWEPHDADYRTHVTAAVACLLDGGCEQAPSG